MLLKMFYITNGCICWSSAMQALCNTYANNVLFNLLTSKGVGLVAVRCSQFQLVTICYRFISFLHQLLLCHEF